MRRGRVFKRCARWGARVTEKRCNKVVDSVRCNGTFSWAYVIDTNSPGSKRRQQRRGGFKTKEEATEAMNRAQVQRADGTYVEPQRLTVGEYLNDWAAAGFGGVRPWTRRGYEVVVRVHLVPRIGDARLQGLTRTQVKALYAQLR